MRLITFLLPLLLFANISSAITYELSEPIDIKQTGWNKVLQASNGNTILFHFEARKPIIIKVFDGEHKEIASEKFSGRIVDMVALERSVLHGIYEINGEAVMFIAQDIVSINTLIRIRFSTKTGRVIKEEKLIVSPSVKNEIKFSIAKDDVDDSYTVFCMKNLEANYKESLELKKYNSKHEEVKTIPVNINTGEYDYVNHVATRADKNGSLIVTLLLQKIVHYPDVMDNDLAVCYLPHGAETFSIALSKLHAEYQPYYNLYTYNEFGKKLNLLLVNAVGGYMMNGLQKIPVVLYNSMLLVYNSMALGRMKYTPLLNVSANKYLKELDSNAGEIYPVPVNMYTNKFGMTTIISEENQQKVLDKNAVTNYACIGNIVVTHINEDGDEIWATVFPKKQFVKNSLTLFELTTRGIHKKLFRRYSPDQDYINQFASFSSFVAPSGTCFVLYNDYPSNFDKQPTEQRDSVYYFEKTDAVCYSIGKRRKVTKEAVFGMPAEGESYSLMIEGGDYNEQKNTYCSIVQHRVGNDYALKLAWIKPGEQP